MYLRDPVQSACRAFRSRGACAAGLVFGVSVSDPLAFTIAVGALALVALVATYLRARRATRVDPMDVIRAM